MARRRGFGEVERRSAGTASSYRARYAMPDGTRHSRTFATKMDAEAWLADERSLIDRDEWTPPQARQAAEATRARGRPSTRSERSPSATWPSAACGRRRSAATRAPGRAGSCRTSARCRCATSPCRRSRRGALARPEDRGDQRGGVPAAALDPPGRRGGGADRPGAAEDPRRRHCSGEAGRRAGDLRRDRGRSSTRCPSG